jgi:hypothetical protein
MSDQADIVRPFVGASFDYYRFQEVTPADGPKAPKEGEEKSPDDPFAFGPFRPNQGGGFDFSAISGESRYRLNDFFGYQASAGAGLFVSRYAPERLVTDFTLDASGNANGLVDSPGGGVTYLGATIPLRVRGGLRLFGALQVPLYLMGQLELEPRGGVAVQNSLGRGPTQGESWVSEVLVKPGLAMVYPIHLDKNRDLILSGAVHFARLSLNSLAGYASSGEPNFSLSAGYYFDSPATIEEKYYKTHRRPEESELDYLGRRCGYRYAFESTADKNICDKYIPMLCAQEPDASQCVDYYKTRRKPNESESQFKERKCRESGACLDHLAELKEQCETNPAGTSCEDYRLLFNKIHRIETPGPKPAPTPASSSETTPKFDPAPQQQPPPTGHDNPYE